MTINIPEWVIEGIIYGVVGALAIVGIAALYVLWKLRNIDFKIGW